MRGTDRRCGCYNITVLIIKEKKQMNAKQSLTMHINAAIMAAKIAAEAHRNDDDGGTCNFDTALLRKPDGITKAEFTAIIEGNGLRANYDNYRNSFGKGYYHITGYQAGQGDRRTNMAEAFSSALKTAGFDSMVWYQMD